MSSDPSLSKLQADIDRLKHAQPAEPEQAPQANPTSQALRMGIELVAGVAAGMVFGYFLDEWLGTSPWAILLGLCLGFVAAIRNMKRSLANNS